MIRIGVSGWSYKSWEKGFYPADLPRRRQLQYLSRVFNSVEVNSSFYSLKRPAIYREWRETSPRGFVYAVKGGRFITHNKKLRGAETPLANFLASGVLALGDRLGPILWQLPATLRFDEERVANFLGSLPRNGREASELAARHDERVAGRSWLDARGSQRIRHALEVRHPSYRVPAFATLLRRYGVSLVLSDAPDWDLIEEVTAGFLYARLHGSTRMYASRYTDAELDHWADRIRRWSGGSEPPDAVRITDWKPPRRKSRDVYIYFDNDSEGHAPHDALRLGRRLGVYPEDEEALAISG